jgi:hypothetical protein
MLTSCRGVECSPERIKNDYGPGMFTCFTKLPRCDDCVLEKYNNGL